MSATPSGTIGLSDVNNTLGIATTNTISMNDTAVRSLAGVTGDRTTISMDNLRNKNTTAYPVYNITSNTTQITINVSQISGYIAGKSVIAINISAGVYVYSTDTATPALTITGSAPGDTVTLVNRGYILGKGGNGGARYANTGTVSASGNYPIYKGYAGGPALSAGCEFSVDNTDGYICGGGGGGHGGWGGGGGGAGGGAGGQDSGNYNAAGAGGGPGSAGSQGGYSTYSYTSGGGGGRICPGSGGAGAINGVYAPGPTSNMSGRGGGAGGGGGGTNVMYQGSGGNGGSSNGAGGSVGTYWPGTATIIGGGATGGGGWGAAGGGIQSTPGAAGGAAILRNGYTIPVSGGNVWN